MMNNEDEILTLLFGLATLIFVISNFPKLRKLPHASLLFLSFSLLVPGWMATLFDQLLWGEFFNAIEHLAYTAGVSTLSIWTLMIAFPRGRRSE